MKHFDKTVRRFSKYDTAAIVLGVFLLFFLLVTARFGVGVPDEAFYYTIPQRLIQGDRLFVEEWHLVQLSSLFSFVPYWIYTTVTGGTEGLILFMRYVFIAVDMIFYVYMYIKLRAYKLWGLIPTFLFCSILPECNYAINYFTVSSMSMMIVCLTLFVDNKKISAGKFIWIGSVFAFGVIAEPLLIFLYLIYFIVVIVWNILNKKRKRTDTYAFFLRTRAWFCFSVGGFLIFVALIIFFTATGTFRDLPKTLPYLFTGVEFNQSNFIEISRIFSVVRIFGAVNIIGFAVCIAAAVYYSVSKQKDNKIKIIVFLLSCIFFLLSSLFCTFRASIGSDADTFVLFIIYHDIPMMLIAPVWYLLCKKKEPRFFLLWLAGILYSVMVDISSDIMLGAGGRIAQTAGMLFLGTLLPELKDALCDLSTQRKLFRHGKVKVKKLFSVVFSVCAVGFIVWNIGYIGIEGFYKPVEKIYDKSKKGAAYSYTLQSGPYKNLKTNETVADIYYATLRDIDKIVQNDEDEKFIAYRLFPYMYLYADLPYACFSAWDQNTIDRQMIYWSLFEEQRPKTIYISFYAFNYSEYPEYYLQNELEEFEKQFENCVISKEEAGYILKILDF